MSVDMCTGTSHSAAQNATGMKLSEHARRQHAPAPAPVHAAATIRVRRSLSQQSCRIFIKNEPNSTPQPSRCGDLYHGNPAEYLLRMNPIQSRAFHLTALRCASQARPAKEKNAVQKKASGVRSTLPCPLAELRISLALHSMVIAMPWMGAA